MPTPKQIVKDCGYNSARSEEGLSEEGTCATCPFGESMPPADAYSIRTATPVTPPTKISSIEQQITDVRDHGGGWVPIVFHEVCDGCSNMAIAVDDFTALLDWLDEQADNGVVRSHRRSGHRRQRAKTSLKDRSISVRLGNWSIHPSRQPTRALTVTSRLLKTKASVGSVPVMGSIPRRGPGLRRRVLGDGLSRSRSAACLRVIRSSSFEEDSGARARPQLNPASRIR